MDTTQAPEIQDPGAKAPRKPADRPHVIRDARTEDIEPIAGILAGAFPALYRFTFGPLPTEETARLLAALYRAGMLSLENTRVYESQGRVLGLLILHVGNPIGRGHIGAYWRLLRGQFGRPRAGRAFGGGLCANATLNRRIPHADDLAYIEALAVAQAERGQGIGTRLLQDAFASCRAQGRVRLALHVLHSNTGARRLYERMGFAPWDGPPSRLPHVSDRFPRLRPRWTALLMARSL